MTWKLNTDRPIFQQIIERIQKDIITGCYTPGDKLPSVRELAATASVNPNTMQRALSELERSGLIHSHRTSGRYITEDESLIKQVKDSIANQVVMHYMQEMKQLGFDNEQAVQALNTAVSTQSMQENEEEL